MDIGRLIKKAVQMGDIVMVYSNGELVETHQTVQLGRAYFSMSNDAFYETYGFNFVPSGEHWELSKRAAGKA